MQIQDFDLHRLWLPALGLGATLGCSSHWTYFIRGEHHLEAFYLFLLFVGVVAVQIALAVAKDQEVRDLAALSGIATASFLFSIFTSIIVYRVYFHPLRAYPGPFLAKISKLWHVSKVTDSKNHLFLESLRQKYGEFVRTGPNELTIFHPDGLVATRSRTSKATKSPWYDILLPELSLNMTREKSTHAKRRRVWDHAFNKKSLQAYEERVSRYTAQLERRVEESAGKSLNMAQWFNFFTVDTMSDLAFGKPLEMLETGQHHFAMEILQSGMAALGPLSPAPWLFIIMSKIPGLSSSWEKMLSWSRKQLKERMEADVMIPDVMHWLIDASKSANTVQQDMKWLYGDSLLIIIAGSDSTAAALTFLFYHLAKNPEWVQKIREELRPLEKEFPANSLQPLANLNATINETLRLHPAVPTGMLRDSPSDGFTIDGNYIPGNVTVAAPLYSIGRLENCYSKPNEWLPQRWTSDADLVKNKDAFAPFSLGPYSCVGKELALQEIRLVVALLVSRFDVSFPPGEDGRECIENWVDQFTSQPGNLNLVFKPCEAK